MILFTRQASALGALNCMGRLLYTPTLELLSRAAKLAALECQSVEWTNLPEESVPVAVFPVGAQRSFHQYNLSQFEMLGAPTDI